MKEFEWLLQTMNFLGEKWVLAILLIIFLEKTTYFTKIKKKLKITSRTLSRKLQLLAGLGLIKKERVQKKRKRHIYTLTELGERTCSYLVQIKSVL